MKALLLILTSLIIFDSPVVGQAIKFSNVIGKQKHEYGIYGNSVFKLDSAGNTIWIKDFSGQIVPSTYSNELIGSAFDGKNLFVLSLQGRDIQSPPHTYNGSVIIMDTAGAVQNIISNSILPGGSYNLIDIFPLVTGGSWLLDDSSPGFTHYGGVQYVDSSGQTGNHINFWYGSITIMNSICHMPDSDYIICANHYHSSMGTDAFPALIKMDYTGAAVWRYNYGTNLTSVIEIMQQKGVVADSLGNIYMICSYISGSYEGSVFIKLNSNGHVLTSNYYDSLITNYITNFRFENDSLLFELNGNTYSFDTLLNNICLTSQSVIVTKFNNYIHSNRIQNFTPSSFNPVNGVPFSYIPQTTSDFCNSLSSPEFVTKEYLTYYPNPAINQLIIKTTAAGIFKLTISDFTGRNLYTGEIQNETSLDVNRFDPGIYNITLTNGSKLLSGKFIVVN